MCTLYERINELCKTKGVSGSRMCLDLGLSKSTLSDIKSGRKKGISTATAQKMASYLGVSVGYLLGDEETEKAPTESGERSVSDDDIKFALFGGDGEITDAMYQEVKEFAALIKLREGMKKSKE
jgi:transcriptional regulator with XRE-family HTH domain